MLLTFLSSTVHILDLDVAFGEVHLFRQYALVFVCRGLPEDHIELVILSLSEGAKLVTQLIRFPLKLLHLSEKAFLSRINDVDGLTLFLLGIFCHDVNSADIVGINIYVVDAVFEFARSFISMFIQWLLDLVLVVLGNRLLEFLGNRDLHDLVIVLLAHG